MAYPFFLPKGTNYNIIRFMNLFVSENVGMIPIRIWYLMQFFSRKLISHKWHNLDVWKLCNSPVKFRYSEKTTKIWKNLPLCFDITKYIIFKKVEDFFTFLWSSQNIWTLCTARNKHVLASRLDLCQSMYAI